MKLNLHKIKWTSGLVIISFTGIILGALFSNKIITYAKDRYTQLQSFTKVLHLIKQYYVEPVSEEKLIEGAIKGMLGELDPHTNYMPAKIFEEFENETAGEFGGLGIEIHVKNEILTIISPIEDTPAWTAGIQAGDKVISINGESTKGMTLTDAAQRIKGKIGTKISLGIFRDGFEKPKEYVIKRAAIKIKSVKYTDLDDGYAFIRITSFIEKTSSDLKNAMNKHIKKHKETKGIIIDLRNNPGGLLQQAIEVSDLFLNDGVIVSTMGRDEKNKEVRYARADGTFNSFPIIILINEYSASASEILAGALQDNKRALIMGSRSFGKGSVQSVIRMEDGSGLKLTVARYYTPKGKSIQAEGIHPDVAVETVNPEAFEKAIIKKSIRREGDIKGHLSNGSKKDKNKILEEVGGLAWYKNIRSNTNKKLSQRDKLLSNDFQALQAYNYLKAWKVFNLMK